MSRPITALILSSTFVLSGCANALTWLAKQQDSGILNPPPIGATDRDKAEAAQTELLTGSDIPTLTDKQKAAFESAAATLGTAQLVSTTANRQYADAVTAEDAARTKADAPNAADADRSDEQVKYKALSDATNAKALADAKLMEATDDYETIAGAIEKSRNGSGIGPISPQAAFFTVQRQSSADPQDRDKALLFLRTGIMASNFMCQRWFTELGNDAVTLHQASDTLSATGSLVTVMAGALQSSPRALAAAAGLFGVGKQSLDAITANYIISPDLAAVQRSLTAYRTSYGNSLLAFSGGYDFPNAKDALTRYDNTCSQLGVKTFVTQQVVKENNAPQAATQLEQQALKTFADKYASTFFKTANLTTDEIAPLYALLFLSPTNDQTTALKKTLAPLIDTNGALSFKNDQSKDETTFRDALQGEGLLPQVIASAQQYLASLAVPAPAAGSQPAAAGGTGNGVIAPATQVPVPATSTQPNAQPQIKMVPPSQPVQ